MGIRVDVEPPAPRTLPGRGFDFVTTQTVLREVFEAGAPDHLSVKAYQDKMDLDIAAGEALSLADAILPIPRSLHKFGDVQIIPRSLHKVEDVQEVSLRVSPYESCE